MATTWPIIDNRPRPQVDPTAPRRVTGGGWPSEFNIGYYNVAGILPFVIVPLFPIERGNDR